MLLILRWLRLFASYALFAFAAFCASHHNDTIYLYKQAIGQAGILINKKSLKQYQTDHALSNKEKENLLLVEQIKNYSIDSLSYLPTQNFTEIFDQKNSPILWVVTACAAYELKPYEWRFPIVGRVSYKGFFSKNQAQKEYYRLRSIGYDAELRSVSAWSTLGWLSDPLLSNMLNYSRGSLCNLLFHELFHATYYAANAVNFNENIASFVAHKATLQFLKNDTSDLREYLKGHNDNLVYCEYMRKKNRFLKQYYRQISEQPNRLLLKLKCIYNMADSIKFLPISSKQKIERWKHEILEQKNACFVDFEQYDSMQDSLEKVFNKFYGGNLKKLVQDLKQNQTIAKFDN
jgi:predicted aminopeptidase